ncbi:Protein HIRA [Galdieria sulphuraria]|uniref:Protein HIRA n=1 Tax=Galdieria sulphuraria TaxID=130081 RepID=M2XVT5_GALSU|nr:protein HIRA/HIR1 isoform 1 [Galdieria sulphuraria]XP_005704055.1 protein HIRA/HIR1 isoform 2 [Galdieria sulphuraria]EME27534.1 protein HIRA/HIR1 isoform 1 [Galdieria sulphuraria]EME27535.1 protein HIRA/HIR1 isoform 2 [Galdieria sulphuraria]GJD06407.1 Protein HIRA [Galdieria sulphuraria]|eukprot:XP_005704054.1 protein HIRA/HIR1 isoform 1 [Galdieria sulphuraria]
MGRALRPEWLTHRVRQGQPHIFSVDIQNIQNNPRIATCGCDGIVRIWFLKALVIGEQDLIGEEQEEGVEVLQVEETRSTEQSSDKNSNSSIPQNALAASLSYHSRSVNMVRWSPQGQWLASAGDDFLVFIYHKEEGKGYSPFGSKEPTPLENWRGRKLSGHSNDVLGVAWSPSGELLASCSVDNTIIIWNVRSDTIVTRLQGHESFVKGLSFDPTGRFLASHGEDLAVLIWKTSDWRIEKEIRETFKESRTVEYQKSLFYRLDWSPCGRELVCSNCLAVHNDKRIHAAVLFHRECNFERPEYFKTSVPVLCVRYSKRMYKSKRDEQVDIGNEAYTAIAFGTASGTLLVWVSKSSKALLALKNACQGPILDLSWSPDGYSLITSSAIGPPLYFQFTEEELGYVLTAKEEKQVFDDVRSKLGANYENVPLTQSTVQLEMEGLYAKHMQEGYLPNQIVSSQEHLEKDKHNGVHQPSLQQKQQEYNVGKKRRIVPKCLSTSNPQENGGSNPLMNTEQTHLAEPIVTNGNEYRNMDSVVVDANLDVHTNLQSEQFQNLQHNDNSCSNQQTRENSSTDGANFFVQHFRKRLESYTPTLGEAWLFHSQETLDNPSNRKLSPFPMEWSKHRMIDEDDKIILRFENDELYCCSNDKILWQAALAKNAHPIALAGEKSTLYAAVSNSNMLHLFSIYGSRLYASIILNARPHMLEVFKGYLFVILVNGEMSLYRIPQIHLVLRASVLPILPEQISEKMGQPIIYPPLISKQEDICLTLYNGSSYLFQRNLGNWICIADDSFIHSEFFHINFSSHSEHESIPQRHLLTWFRKMVGKMTTPKIANVKPTKVLLESIAHLETMMASADILNSKEEFRKLLLCYIEKLCSIQATELPSRMDKLKQVLDDILQGKDGFFSRNLDSFEKTTFMLQVVLPIVSKNRQLQNVAEEYVEKIRSM